MRRAGYEVRVLAEEGASFEQNPPTLVEFIRRDLRWCQGNMQYWHFLRMPGLQPVSRYQLVFALLMFLGSPAWIGLLLVGTLGGRAGADAGRFHAMGCGHRAPLLRAGDVVCAQYRHHDRRADAVRSCATFSEAEFASVASFLMTIIFVVLVAPIMWVSHTVFLARLLFGRTIEWGAQARDDHEVPWSLALRHFWPQTLVGLVPSARARRQRAVCHSLCASSSQAVRCCRSRSRWRPPRRRLGRALIAARARSIAGGDPAAAGIARAGTARHRAVAARPVKRSMRRQPWYETWYGSWHESWRTTRGVVRSLRLYYGDRERRAAMDRLYSRFVKAGDLVFDIGAHVGDRVAVFRRFGARVVAVEPQPALIRTLKLLYGRDPRAGDRAGRRRTQCGNARAQAQRRQSDGVDGIGGLPQGGRRRRGLGGPGMDQNHPRAGHDARRPDLPATARPPSSRSMSRVPKRKRWRD